jgi:hypothetical protein
MATYVVDDVPRIPIKVLSQCAGAGIDLYANWVSMVVSKNFNLSVRGQRNINNALNNLPIYYTSEDSLTLGWTLEHALRNRGVHEGAGYEHLALEVVLSETFPERYAARVLHEMAIAYADRSDITPHFYQLRNLVRSSNGIFTSSDFGLLVEDHIRLDPRNLAFQEAGDEAGRVPSPKSLSLALRALTHVTNGREKQMIAVGGQILGWFAAVGEWLFDLRIAIYSSAGECLHATHENQDTQVLLVYDEKPGIYARIDSWTSDSVQAKEAAMRSRPDGEKSCLVPFGGRVVWNSLLPRVFGRSFYHLDHNENNTLGAALGAAARAFQGFAEDKDFGDLVSAQNKSNPASFGRGLIRTLTDWLPELRRLQGRMERQLKLSLEDAQKVYFEQIQRLKIVCGCSICAPMDMNTSASNIKRPQYGYCLTVLVETIITFGLILSRVTVAPQIYPTRAGIQSFYLNGVVRRIQARNVDISDKEKFNIIHGNEWNAPNARRLQSCAELFSGSRPMEDIPENLMALAHEGICVYLVKIERSEGASRTESDGLIRVVSGGICVRQKVYGRGCLGPVADADEFENVWEEVVCAHLSQSLYCK